MAETQSWTEQIQAKLEEEGRDAGRMRVGVACELFGTDPDNCRAYMEELVQTELSNSPYKGKLDLTEKDRINATREVVNAALQSLDGLAEDRALEDDPERYKVAHEAMLVWLDVGRAIQAEVGR